MQLARDAADYVNEILKGTAVNAKRDGKTIAAKPRPRGENVVDLMDALKRSIGAEKTTKAKKPRKASAGQKEMLLPIAGKKARKEVANAPQGQILLCASNKLKGRSGCPDPPFSHLSLCRVGLRLSV